MTKRSLILTVIVAVCAGSSWGSSDYLTDAVAQYPGIASSKLNSCTLCHTSVPSRNSYGAAWRTGGRNFTAVEGLDSDGDTVSNLLEITSLTYPGNATDTPKGSVQVTILPAGAVTAGAQWRIGTTGVYQNSGVTVSAVVIGSKTIQFKPVTGWTAPADKTVTVQANLTASTTGTYVQPLATVPNVAGLTQVAATTAITGASLVLGTVTQASSSTVPAGSVISQTPASGTQVAQGSAVNLVISSGPPMVAVPNVAGLTQAAATTAITGAGLVVGLVAQSSSNTVPAGRVISQTPASGAQAVLGSAVNFVVSTGPPPVAVPDVTGMAQADATTAITSAGLVLGTVTLAASTTVPAGDVISQSPAPGTQAAQGSSVNLVVAVDPATALTLTSPNGGEMLEPRVSYDITWTTVGLTGGARIDLYWMGLKQRTICSYVDIALGSWAWTVHPKEIVGGRYKIKIFALSNPQINDFSDRPFTVFGISLTSPGTGAAWPQGSTQTISWIQGGLDTDTFRVDVYDGSVKVTTILRYVSATTGSFNWHIPAAGKLGTNYRIKVFSLNDPTVTAFSPKFSVVTP